jgi:hypothetical protein
MSATLVIGLLFQLLALLILAAVVGRRWFSYVGALFIVMALIFHGLTEFVQSALPGQNPYRLLVSQSQIDEWVLLVGVGILVLTIAYVLSLAGIGSRETVAETVVANEISSPVDWRLAFGACLPLYLVAISAITLRSPLEQPIQTGGWDYFILGLTAQFLVLGVVLTSFSYLVEHKGRHVFAVLFLQSLALALLGERLTVLIAILMLLHALATTGVRVGVSVKSKHVLLSLLLCGLIATIISSARIAVGRDHLKGSAGQRIEALLSGVDFLESEGGSGISEDFVSRFDGNAFPALIKSRIDEGWATTNGRGLINNLKLAIPSFIYTSKLETEVTERVEDVDLQAHFGLPEDIDVIPTLLGTFYSYRGAVPFLGICLLMGLGFAFIDRWIQRKQTLWTLVVQLAVVYCIGLYERDTGTYFVTLRGVILLVIMLKLGAATTRALQHPVTPLPGARKPTDRISPMVESG